MRSYKKYKQGVFNPKNKTKYKGITPIIFRSGLELKYMRWCDDSSSVLEWGSESVVIPYIKPIDGKVHKYYVDFDIVVKNKEGNIQKYLIEIKPYKQTIPPTTTPTKNKMRLLKEQVTYATNLSKWTAAQQWCKKLGYEFLIVTDRDLNK